MKDKPSPFFAYRYLVTHVDGQSSIIHQLNEPKEKLMEGIVKDLSINKKTVWTKGKRRYLFYGSQHDENVYIIKYARETKKNLFVEGDEDVEMEDVKETNFVFLIIDTKYQIVLIERNVNIFSSVKYAISVLAEFFREKMLEYDYAVNIYPLSSNKKFWNYVESADEIFELSLVMNAPNMPLFGRQDIREVLQLVKDTTNNEEFDLAFKNKEGKLKILKESLGGWIDYVREVGGRYVLKISKNGVPDTKTSDTDTAKTYIVRKKTDKYSDEEIEIIKEKLAAMHTLAKRDDENES